MFIGTHFSAPVILAGGINLVSLLRTRERIFSNGALIAIGICGILPDLLNPHLRLTARLTSWTHTLWFLAACFSVIAFLWFRYPQFNIRVGIMCGAAVGLHLLGDALSGGIALGYPFSDLRMGKYWISYRIWLQLDLVTVGGMIGITLFGSWIERARAAF